MVEIGCENLAAGKFSETFAPRFLRCLVALELSRARHAGSRSETGDFMEKTIREQGTREMSVCSPEQAHTVMAIIQGCSLSLRTTSNHASESQKRRAYGDIKPLKK
jgi:hypothetical protein